MPFSEVMLARPLDKKFVFTPNTYAVEEKLDGIRIESETSSGASNLFTHKLITPWSRYGRVHPLPTHIMEELAKFPPSILDGEIFIAGKRSYGAVELTNLPDLEFRVFDILELEGTPVVDLTYDQRRQLLCSFIPLNGYVTLNPSHNVDTMDEVYRIRDEVWARDGEGLILKRRSAPYQIGKRSKDWVKIKQLRSAVLTVIGFMPSRGQINDRGPFAMIVIQDEDLNVTTVKTRNDMECRLLEKEFGTREMIWNETRFMGKPMKMIVNHPSVGRRLVISYQERTPDGNYRHPRFDHWE
jgi:bifunctional non-homologous end joining protein LigD